MATVNLPLVPSIPNYRVGTVLDGTQYLIDVRWNGRASTWFMDFYQADETPIRMGIAIVLGVILNGLCVDPAFPPGAMVAIDTSNQDLDAGLDDLGTRVVVAYFPVADILAAPVS